MSNHTGGHMCGHKGPQAGHRNQRITQHNLYKNDQRPRHYRCNALPLPMRDSAAADPPGNMPNFTKTWSGQRGLYGRSSGSSGRMWAIASAFLDRWAWPTRWPSSVTS
mmetsp:Transcript_61259/g.171304  ORF Transcript_61259/g.171304 Transcript_61259/m.171304 type:complete len:108 (-) Transcript_61259:676-999(-)